MGVRGGSGTNSPGHGAATALYWGPPLGKGTGGVTSMMTLVVAVGAAPALSSALELPGALEVRFSAHANATECVNPHWSCSLSALAGLSVNGLCKPNV